MRGVSIVVGDWGTSRLRLSLIVDGRVVDRVEGPGIRVAGARAATVLHDLLVRFMAHEPRRLALCGMAGSRQGLIETPYADCPVDVSGWREAAVEGSFASLPLILAPGAACQRDHGTPDLMRGEETQIFGALSLSHELGCDTRLMVLPGTHSKWVRVIDGRIVTFHTFLTGELFALLRDHSTLSFSTGERPASDAGFAAGLTRAASEPLLGSLFETRAAQLRAGRGPGWALGFLSGLLIGHELNEGLAAFGSAGTVNLIGDPLLTHTYHMALRHRGIEGVEIDGEVCAVAGLKLLAGTTDESS